MVEGNVERISYHLALGLSANEELITSALSQPSYTLRLPKSLESQYQLDQKEDRLHYQRRVGLAGILLFMVFLISDAVVVPDVFWLGAVLRLACLLIMLVTLGTLRLKMPEWLMNALVASFTLPAIATIALLFSASRAPDRVAYLNGIMVCVTFANICLRQQIEWAAGSNALMLGIAVIGLYTSHVASSVQVLQLLLLMTIMTLTLLVTHQLERQFRRNYLFRRQDCLRRIELQRSNALLTDLSERDELTGLANRRRINRHLEEAWVTSISKREHLAVIMLDVDWFKQFNDTYGHPAGDTCLRKIAGVIHDLTGPATGLAGRYGGEEFIVIIQANNAILAPSLAESLRMAVERLNIPHSGNPVCRKVTVSLGLACTRPHATLSVTDLLKSADNALYAAKRAGRARLVSAPMAS